jgi:alpha-tubulin suppressor-like RCC1 family protein
MVSAGSFHSLLVTASGVAYSFGSGDNGRLGHGDTSNRLTPTAIAGAGREL